MADKKMFFLYNPKAGKAQVKNHLMNIIDVFVKGGYRVEVYPTQGRRDAVRAIRDRQKGFDLLVCCGGDGTLDEVVTGMLESGEILPLGYIPAGSTNDFANSLKLPKSMVKAANLIVGAEILPVISERSTKGCLSILPPLGCLRTFPTGQGRR